MRLELAWGRVRRFGLRTFRRAYVQRMAEKRLGSCPNCPHDIVDVRDLKYYRNVCGYWFAKEDDPFHWRDDLGFARVGLAEVCIISSVMVLVLAFLSAAGNLIHRSLWGPIPVLLVCWAFVLWFFRDPDRDIPTARNALLSPADGTVTHVGVVDEPDFPGGQAFRISIFLSIFNVHVNRIPRTCQVVRLRYFPGRFLDARNPACSLQNEQLWIDLEEHDPPRPIRVKQISGAIARRIVCWLKPGQTVWAGERLGMIKFGSRTDVCIPVDAAKEVLVHVGDKVKGGSTILLKLRDEAAS
ncbi:MAG TPA: phosphatidylserine decarboxylase [Gemmataceae bacterium]|nr:phosphatidylserine decarboxylase [Gemmataceae bacterium]